jgi:uncharacterized protein (DUF1501 family)
MKRRKFLRNTTAALIGLPAALNGLSVSPIRQSAFLDALNPDSDRVLVLIQMIGGNDGLNMIVPLDYYDQLYNVRQNVILPASSLEEFDNNLAFHPTMKGIRSMFDDAKLKVIQGVGYPDQNRSHFRSTDIWTSGSPANEDWSTGWLGRYLTEDHADFPNNYPNDANPDPLAISIGNSISLTCQGTVGNFSLPLTDPFNLGQLAAGGDDFIPDGLYGDQLEFVRVTIEQTNAYSERITEIANQGTNTATYPDTNLAQQLKTIALLLAGGSKTRIFVASIGGFDTHANQVETNDPLEGEHTELLQKLSGAISAFQTDLEGLGLSERVIGMTFSEFGRRIKSNDSSGTDHGSAAPLMVFGSCVHAGVLGSNAEIGDEVGNQDGVAMQFDFRDIYGSILEDWFEVDEELIKELLHTDYTRINFLNACADSPPTDTQNLADESLEVSLFPNPAHNYVNVHFESQRERVSVTLFNSEGKLMETFMDRSLNAGKHETRFDISKYPSGNYFVRVVCSGHRQSSRIFTKF